jgi:UDP-glucose 4-epimerase|tara:strand:- start:1003 stop:1914 length:912 start_codon:yes stop_codon:yes gene_type:complete
MRYVVTGGAGFIGSNLTDQLIKDGHEVVVLDNLSTGKVENVNPKAQLVILDIAGRGYADKAIKAISDADGIFHMAALARVQPSIENPYDFNRVNVLGTLNMLMWAKQVGVKRFVYSASSSAYGNASITPTPETHPTDPLSPYGLQKLIGEQYCRVFYHCYGLETVSLRYFNVFGERQALEGAYCLVMGIFANQVLNKKPITICGDGEQRRDFTYVGDVVKANILAMASKNVGSGEVINIGSGDNRSVNQLADLFNGEKLYIKERLEPRETLADNSKAKELLGWTPTVSVEDWAPKYKKDLGII